MGRVVLDGDVVRRPAGPWTAWVHELLRSLPDHPDGFAPRPVGIDGSWETVTWVPGEVGQRPLSANVRSEDALVSVARLLRRFHDAVDGAVCHNDVGPWNVVFRGSCAVALIDWDLAGPGAALSDLASAVWHFAPLYDDAECLRIGWPSVPDRLARAELLCRAYGVPLDAAVWESIRERQRWYLSQVLAAQAQPEGPGSEPWLKVNPASVVADMRWIAELDTAG